MSINLELVARNAGRALDRGDLIIVIDVLRCTSSIITALANGANGILPVRTVKEARKIHKDHLSYTLAGERSGIKPQGFDLGNSPLGFKKGISGKIVILTTTSGTETLFRVRGGKHVLIGAFLNAKFVAEAANKISEKEGCGISLVLSGKRGRFSLEDFLGAGAILENFPNDRTGKSDIVYASYLAFSKAKESLIASIQKGSHAETLRNIGFKKDIIFCSQLNKYKIVPCLRAGMIVPLDTD